MAIAVAGREMGREGRKEGRKKVVVGGSAKTSKLDSFFLKRNQTPPPLVSVGTLVPSLFSEKSICG